jgi:hypothetical protein
MGKVINMAEWCRRKRDAEILDERITRIHANLRKSRDLREILGDDIDAELSI